MGVNLQEFGSKLKRYREQLKLSLPEVVASTGVDEGRLAGFEEGVIAPSGDEVLILADFYKCDYRFFISNERFAPFEQTESLYRRYGTEFSKEDRWSVQEFLFLCECEEYLLREGPRRHGEFQFKPQGKFLKAHGEAAGASLRKYLGYGQQDVPGDVYSDFRRIGVHVFRRHLNNSNISGLMIRHPFAGSCVLVNYSEDIYRQRFTVAHEAAHAILDREEFVVSFEKWERGNLIEIRANTFASRYLLPPSVLTNLPEHRWNQENLVRWANALKVSAIALAIGLKESQLIDEDAFASLSGVRVPREVKSDPELAGLTGKALQRKRSLLERGLSAAYVSSCFYGLSHSVITNARDAEIVL